MIASEAAGARWALSQFTWLLSARCAGDRVLHAIQLCLLASLLCFWKTLVSNESHATHDRLISSLRKAPPDTPNRVNATCIPTLIGLALLLLAPSANADERASLLGRRQRQEAPQRDLDQGRLGDVVLDNRGDAQ